LILGRYELLAPVAKGGMAQVWVARLTGTRGFQKTVAIKTMLPNLSADAQFEQMFLDEASLASRVRHPNAVEILDLGEDAGVLYLVMEWIEGEPLSVLMKQASQNGGIPLPLAVRIVMQACGGLQAAHELRDDEGKLVGLVHRDVSPQNILVSYAGVVKVVDFGVAKAAGRLSEQTSAGQIKGKIPYMSPEQASGALIDRRTDVFAMGILLYMMTTGKHPFRKENDAHTMLNICSEASVVPPSAVEEDYPEELEAIVLKALAKPMEQRFQTAAEMQKALDALPRELRASTEEELGEFVRGLLAERMEKRRALIQTALKEADARAEGRRTSVDGVIEERSGAQLTPLSGVSRLSHFEGVASSSTPSTMKQLAVVAETTEHSGASVITGTGTHRSRKHPAINIIGGLGLGAGAALGLFLILQARSPHPERPAAMAPPPPGVPAVEPIPPAVTEPIPERPAAAVLQIDDLDAVEPSGVEILEELEGAPPNDAPRVGEKPALKARVAPAPATPPSGTGEPKAEAKPSSKPFISPFAKPDF
jgi:eukaryotic-like serine/threonine-protein kinase